MIKSLEKQFIEIPYIYTDEQNNIFHKTCRGNISCRSIDIFLSGYIHIFRYGSHLINARSSIMRKTQKNSY